MKKEISFGTIVPLIGGATIGCMKALHGKKPEWIISYPGFAGNDKHLLNYLGEAVPYLQLDPNTNKPLAKATGEFTDEGIEIVKPSWDLDNLDRVDFVNAVPPCAGLSLLNSSNKKDSATSRGSHAAQNDWMYKTAEFVLENIKPRVFWGENAPGLYTKNGKGVRDELRKICKKYGYSFSVMKTDTFIHGIPQKRARTFFFLWDSENAPILNYYKRPHKTLSEYLAEIPKSASGQDKFLQGESGKDMMKNKFIEWLVNVDKKSPSEVAKMGFKTFYLYAVCTKVDPLNPKRRKLHEVIEWFEGFTSQEDIDKKTTNGKYLRALYHVNEKFKMGKGWWDSSPHLWLDHINAVIGRTMEQSIHPTEPRFINVREYMHLMGLPHDFDLVGSGWNHIAQNVPVTTMRDWADEVIKYINGELENSGADYIKQNNINRKIEFRNSTSKSLFGDISKIKKSEESDTDKAFIGDIEEPVKILETSKNLF